MIYFTVSCYTVNENGYPIVITGPVDGISKEDAMIRFVDDMDLDIEYSDIEISGPIWYEEVDGVTYPNEMLN